jgi:hypothetical protein
MAMALEHLTTFFFLSFIEFAKKVLLEQKRHQRWQAKVSTQRQQQRSHIQSPCQFPESYS